MANEIVANHLTSKTLYAAVFNAAGLVYRTSTGLFEAWGTSGRTAADYDIALTETAAGASMHYTGTFPVIVAAVYSVTVFDRATGTPLNSDIAIGDGEMHWDGTDEINDTTLNELLETIDSTTNRIVIDDTDGTGGTSSSGGSVAGKTHDC